MTKVLMISCYGKPKRHAKALKIMLTVVACTSGNLVIQVQHGFSFKKIG